MLKVLIADDEQLICRMLTKMIDWEKEGLELLDCVYNGRDVLDAIENKRPDIVITDIQLFNLPAFFGSNANDAF